MPCFIIDSCISFIVSWYFQVQRLDRCRTYLLQEHKMSYRWGGYQTFPYAQMTWHDMTWHHAVITHHVTPFPLCPVQYLMTHTMMSFAATTNIIKYETLSYTDLNYHYHHLSLRNLTTTSRGTLLHSLSWLKQASATELIVSSPARLHYLPHVFIVSLLACWLSIFLLISTFLSLMSFMT